MSGGRRRKVIYETQSTHKLLAAFSQASMIHVKGDVNEETFNEAYMMHTHHHLRTTVSWRPLKPLRR